MRFLYQLFEFVLVNHCLLVIDNLFDCDDKILGV